MQKSKIFLCSVWKMLYLCTRIQRQVGSFGEMAECIMFSNKKRLTKKQSLFLLSWDMLSYLVLPKIKQPERILFSGCIVLVKLILLFIKYIFNSLIVFYIIDS